MQIVFDDMIVDMLSNIYWYAELFVRVKKLNFSLVFIIKSYFAVPKNIRMNPSHLFHYVNVKKTRASPNCIESFIRYWF